MTSITTFQQEELFSLITMDDGKANAVSPILLEELHAALDQAEAAGKPVVLKGREGKFSAGFDLSIMSQGGRAMGELVANGAKLSQRLLTFPTPVVALSTGHAMAMGGLLLLSVDYRIGLQGNFKIGLNEVAIGMTMPYFGVELGRGRLNTAYFDRAVGNAELFLPDQAVAAGFLDCVADAEGIQATVEAVVAHLSKLNMSAHKNTKLRVRKPLLDALAAGIEKEFGALAQ